MPYDIEDSVIIQAQPELVWKWVAEDVDRERSWRNINGRGVMSLERLDQDELGVGSKFRGTVKIGPGKAQAYVNEVTELLPQERIAWRTIEGDGVLGGVGVYELTAEGDTTRFDIKLDYPPRKLAGRLMRPVVRLFGKRATKPMLAKLKHSVEAEAA